MYSLSDFDDDAIAEFRRARNDKGRRPSVMGRTLAGKLARAGVATAAIGAGGYALAKGRKGGATRINPTPITPKPAGGGGQKALPAGRSSSPPPQRSTPRALPPGGSGMKALPPASEPKDERVRSGTGFRGATKNWGQRKTAGAKSFVRQARKQRLARTAEGLRRTREAWRSRGRIN